MTSAGSHRILVVGTGSIGERHVRCFQRTHRAQVAICEIKASLREAVADRYGIQQVHVSLDDALGRVGETASNFDAAVVAAPAHVHRPLATRCLEAGLPVLIEKPLAVEETDGAAIVRCAVSQEAIAAVAYTYRAHPALRRMREAIRKGRFGRPLQLVAVSGQHFPAYRPAYADTYYADYATGGGAVQDALTHVVNAAEWLVGPISRVAADTARLSLPGVEVEDTVHAIARHGPVMASYSLNQHQMLNENHVTVVCERGLARFDLSNHAWRWMDEPDGRWETWSAEFGDRDDWFTAQQHVFLDALEGKADPLCSVGEAQQTLRACRAVMASAADGGRWIDIN